MLAAACLVLLASTCMAFRPALDKDFSFVNLDDNRYINEHVVQGLTRESITWAFTSLEYDILREPRGCFEQTSSTNYPLAMAQAYFLTHQGVDPKLIAQAKNSSSRAISDSSALSARTRAMNGSAAAPPATRPSPPTA